MLPFACDQGRNCIDDCTAREATPAWNGKEVDRRHTGSLRRGLWSD